MQSFDRWATAVCWWFWRHILCIFTGTANLHGNVLQKESVSKVCLLIQCCSIWAYFLGKTAIMIHYKIHWYLNMPKSPLVAIVFWIQIILLCITPFGAILSSLIGMHQYIFPLQFLDKYQQSCFCYLLSSFFSIFKQMWTQTLQTTFTRNHRVKGLLSLHGYDDNTWKAFFHVSMSTRTHAFTHSFCGVLVFNGGSFYHSSYTGNHYIVVCQFHSHSLF